MQKKKKNRHAEQLKTKGKTTKEQTEATHRVMLIKLQSRLEMFPTEGFLITGNVTRQLLI